MTDDVKPQGTILIATSLGADSGLALVQGASGDEVHALSGTFAIAGIGTDGKIRLLTADDLGASGLTQAEVIALLAAGTAPHKATHETSGSDELETLSPSVLTPSGLVSLTGVLTPSQITADQNDYAPTNGAANTVWRLSTDASRNITGISIGQTSGRLLLLKNVGNFNITIINNSTSTAANRFDIGINLAMQPNDSVLLIYDATTSRWSLVTSSPVSSNTPQPIGVATPGTNQRPSSATHVHDITSAEVLASGNTTMTNANTNYDVAGVSVSLPAGTYEVVATVTILAAASITNCYLFIWDGTTKYGVGATTVALSLYGQITAIARFTLGSTTTVKLSTRSPNAGNSVVQSPDSQGVATKMTYKKVG